MTTSTLLIIKDALARSAEWLARRGIDPPRLDAELLLAEVLGMSRLDLYLAWDRPLDEGEKERYRALLKRRGDFEPVAYILGRKEFFSLELRVTPHVLIPRPETELLVERTLEVLETLEAESAEEEFQPAIADVGTGSGAIAIALATTLPSARIVATDLSAEALEVARENAGRHGVDDVIEFRRTSLLEGVEGPLDVVVSNPPYVAERDRATLPRDVVDYEPEGALFAGDDGLDAVRLLIPQAAERLRPGGWLLLEIGEGQADETLGLAAADGRFEPGAKCADYRGIDRVVVARRAP